MPAAQQANLGMQGSRRCYVSWFAETWDFQEVQQQWPCLTKEAQRYIACFETQAQLAPMRIAWTAEGQAVHGLCMPSGTDNTAPEAKLFTTAWPLQIFVELVAAWAYKHKWSVLSTTCGPISSAAATHPHSTASRKLAFVFARMISGPTNAGYHCIRPTPRGGRSIRVLRKRSEEGVID